MAVNVQHAAHSPLLASRPSYPVPPLCPATARIAASRAPLDPVATAPVTPWIPRFTTFLGAQAIFLRRAEQFHAVVDWRLQSSTERARVIAPRQGAQHRPVDSGFSWTPRLGRDEPALVVHDVGFHDDSRSRSRLGLTLARESRDAPASPHHSPPAQVLRTWMHQPHSESPERRGGRSKSHRRPGDRPPVVAIDDQARRPLRRVRRGRTVRISPYAGGRASCTPHSTHRSGLGCVHSARSDARCLASDVLHPETEPPCANLFPCVGRSSQL